jgi:hypothetical protein
MRAPDISITVTDCNNVSSLPATIQDRERDYRRIPIEIYLALRGLIRISLFGACKLGSSMTHDTEQNQIR